MTTGVTCHINKQPIKISYMWLPVFEIKETLILYLYTFEIVAMCAAVSAYLKSLL